MAVAQRHLPSVNWRLRHHIPVPADSRRHTTRVNVPGLCSSVEVSGVSGDNLVLLAKAGCGPSTSLLSYNPAANTATVLLGPPVNGGSVAEAMTYPGPK
jgi:hypothetical protein